MVYILGLKNQLQFRLNLKSLQTAPPTLTQYKLRWRSSTATPESSLPHTNYNYSIIHNGRGCRSDTRVSNIYRRHFIEPNIAFRLSLVPTGTDFKR